MAEGKKELIGLLSSETNPIHSLSFIKTCPSLGEHKKYTAMITFIPGRRRGGVLIVCVCLPVLQGDRGGSTCVYVFAFVRARGWAESRHQSQGGDGSGGRRVYACSSICAEYLSRSQRHCSCACVAKTFTCERIVLCAWMPARLYTDTQTNGRRHAWMHPQTISKHILPLFSWCFYLRWLTISAFNAENMSGNSFILFCQPAHHWWPLWEYRWKGAFSYSICRCNTYKMDFY